MSSALWNFSFKSAPISQIQQIFLLLSEKEKGKMNESSRERKRGDVKGTVIRNIIAHNLPGTVIILLGAVLCSNNIINVILIANSNF